MEKYNLRDQIAEVNRYLNELRISKAIGIVREMLQQTDLQALIPKLENISQTYKYMTGYMLDGTQDPGRDKLLAEMSEQLRALADQALRAKLAMDSSDYYYSTLRLTRFRKERISDILEEYGMVSSELALAEAAGNADLMLRKRRQEQLSRLFDNIFTSLGADSEYGDLKRYLVSGYSDETVAVQSLAALTLALLNFYDRSKFITLLDIYDGSEEPKIAARALVGILLALIPNAERIASDKLIMARMSVEFESDENRQRITNAVKNIVGTRDTERVANKMKDEILPELMKLRPELLKAIREQSLDPESIIENNPEWEELLNNSKLGEKMQEIGDMQSNGADLMMVTFSNLKQFPFFNQASNWFLPFDSRHPDLKLPTQMQKIISVMQAGGPMICDSDLYSLAIASSQMPEAQMNMMTRQFSENFEQIAEENQVDLEKALVSDFDNEALKAVRELYRFYKLFRKREGMFDPFGSPLKLNRLPIVGEIMSSPDMLQLFGEFYFKRSYYSDALPLLIELEKSTPDDGILCEKIGFCYQSEGEFAKALESYDKAALLKIPGKWLLKKLAFVNRCLGRYDEAAGYYQQLLEEDNENVSLMMNAGSMLLQTGDIAGALAQFYHANYVRSEDLKVYRAIAWAELLNGNYGKSADYNARIISREPVASDYLNAGHAAFMSGKNREALNYYLLSAAEDKNAFETAFQSDMASLADLPGYDPSTHKLLLDLTLA